MRASHAALKTSVATGGGGGVTIIQKTASASGVTSVSLTGCGAGNNLICLAYWDHQVSSAAPTGWTQAVTSEQSTNYGTCAIYYKENISAGSQTFTSAQTTLLTYMHISEWSGLLTSSSLCANGTGFARGTGSPTSTTSGSISNSSGLIVAGAAFHYNLTPGTGYTELSLGSSGGANPQYESEYKLVSASGVQTATWGVNPAAAGGTAAIAVFH